MEHSYCVEEDSCMVRLGRQDHLQLLFMDLPALSRPLFLLCYTFVFGDLHMSYTYHSC